MRVVLLHGFASAPAMFDAMLAALPARVAARGGGSALELERPVLPGHGLSPRDMHVDFDGAAELLLASLVRERGPAPTVVVGYSLGGRLAVAMAARDPRVHPLLIGAHVGLRSPSERRARKRWEADEALRIRREGMAAFVRRWEALPIFASQSDAQRAAQRGLRSAHTAEGLAWAMETLGLSRMADHRAALRGRGWWLTGGLDDKLTRIAAEVGGHHRVVPGMGHNLVLEAPGLVADELAALLSQVSRG